MDFCIWWKEIVLKFLPHSLFDMQLQSFQASGPRTFSALDQWNMARWKKKKLLEELLGGAGEEKQIVRLHKDQKNPESLVSN